jgi:hypothetical protein
MVEGFFLHNILLHLVVKSFVGSIDIPTCGVGSSGVSLGMDKVP